MREIILDTETTGLKPEEGHRIIEIGAVEVINYFRTGRHFHTYINPEAKVSEGAYKVHGISNEFLRDKKLFKDIVPEFLEFLADSRLIIHNAPFDMGFLNYQLNVTGVPAIDSGRVFDTLAYARKNYPGGRHSLDALCERFSVDNTKRDKHGALLDAELLADVYAEMMGAGSNQRNIIFANTKKNSEQQTATKEQKPFREPRNFPATAEEIELHAEFLKTIKTPIWNS